MAQGDEKWWEAFAYMSPEAQQEMLAQVGYIPTGADQTMGMGTDLMGGALQPSFADPLYYSEDVEPMFGAVGALPEYTSKGALDPRDLSQVAKGVNLAQDYGALMVDNALTGLSGVGSYDIDAFTPRAEYGKEVTRPGNDRLQAMAGRGGWEGFIANEMLNGASPSAAIASLEARLQEGDAGYDELSDRDKADFDTLKASLPRAKTDPLTGALPANPRGSNAPRSFWDDYNYDRIWGVAEDLDKAVFEDPAFGYSEVGDDGKVHYYETAPITVRTDQMKWFDKYGLPYPTAQYTDPEYMEAFETRTRGTPEEREAADAEWKKQYNTATVDVITANAARRQLDANEQAMRDAWDKMIPASRGRFVAPEAPEFPAYDERLGPSGTGRYETPRVTVTPEDWEAAQFGAGAVGQPPRPEEGLASTWNPAAPARSRMPLSPVPSHRPPLEGLASTWDPNAVVPARNVPMVQVTDTGDITLAPTDWVEGDTMGNWFNYTRNRDIKPGSRARRMRESDIGVEASRKRRGKAADRRIKAEREQQRVSYQNPRLSTYEQMGVMDTLARQGRTPYQDAVAQRVMGMRALGL